MMFYSVFLKSFSANIAWECIR